MNKRKRESITRRYRKVSWGRLLWKSRNFHNRNFDRDDVCMVIDGTLRIHYHSVDALIKDIEYAEWVQNRGA